MVLEKLDERGMMSEICDAMDLNHHLLDREATQVSGGELQRFSIAAVCLKKPDIYVFNKPSNFLDPTAYGVVTLPFSVREGINVFLAGFVPTENLRFRDESLNFKVSDKPQESEGKVKSYARYKYPNMNYCYAWGERYWENNIHPDAGNFRPRINKLESTKDREQKLAGSYYLDD
ncbi:hypothetical protein Bca52824_087860 [Brassica carinata]|uniref:ABC transporter domain-containing protein n=1 Tax=Brassica carinata TaxID=52824 RepID=A0A8X7PCM6_BRACI|nr:hypothetical protein Bca52824_087860 [Brassica carinata]